MIYYCDGGGWSGTTALWAVTDAKENPVLEVVCRRETTNNEAEYRAILYAMEIAQDGDTIRSDSQLAVRQILGRYKTKAPHLIPLVTQAQFILSLKRLKVEWVRRHQNVAGRYLERVRKCGRLNVEV